MAYSPQTVLEVLQESCDGSFGTVEMGTLIIENEVDQLVEIITSVKSDQRTFELQKQFYEDANHPIRTEQ